MGSLNLHLIILSIGLCVGYPTLVCEERVWVLSVCLVGGFEWYNVPDP